MSEQPNQDKRLSVSNYDKVRALARNKTVLESFTALLGNRTEAQAYISSALLAVANNSDLMLCQPASIMSCALRVATLHLSCDPSLGQAYLVPYNDKHKGKIATVQLGYKGIEQMALRTEKYRFINTDHLYEGEVLKQDRLTGAVTFSGQRAGDKILGYYNYFELRSGYSHCLYMTVEEIRAHGKKYSQNYDNPKSKWQTEFDKMARKTVLRLHLLRDGVMTTQDRAILEAMKIEGEVMEGEVIDTTFENIDATAEAEAAAAEMEKNKPGLEETLTTLGFPPDKPGEAQPSQPEKPAALQPERPWTNTKVSLQMAKAEKSSEGLLYWEMPTEKLVPRFNSLEKSLKDNHLEPAERETKMLKRDVIQAILDYRAPTSLL